MDPTQLLPNKRNPTSTAPPKPLLEFSSYMEEEVMEEKEEETPLMDGPVSVPFIPACTLSIAALPKELQPLIAPIPECIQTAVKTAVSEITIIVQLPSLENVEVVIDHYDTAPSSFHISFYGSETTGALITQNQTVLLSSLHALFPHFAFAISPPFYGTPSFSLPKTKRFGYCPVKQGKKQR